MGELITTTVEGKSLQGYYAESTGPGIIVIQEWWGLVDHIKHIVDRFAAEGFTAFAPDLYHGQVAKEPDTAKKLAMELEFGSAAQEISSAAKFLHSKTGSQIGVVGFCMGGTLSIWAATLVPEIAASVAFYPGASWSRHNPQWANMNKKKVMIHCSEGDGTSAAPGIQEALSKITGAGGVVTAFDYPGTQHAFFNDDRPEVYDKAAAELSWSRTLDFFQTNLSKA